MPVIAASVVETGPDKGQPEELDDVTSGNPGSGEEIKTVSSNQDVGGTTNESDGGQASGSVAVTASSSSQGDVKPEVD